MASTLTKKAQRYTLSGKKKNVTKYILCTPFKETSKKIDKNTQGQILDKLTRSLRASDKGKSLKKQLKIGVNETTKYLEKDLLRLVLVDSSANLPTMHLRQLCGVRQCPLIILNNLEATCSELIDVTRLACFGVLKECTGHLKEFAEFASPFAPANDLPWLDFEKTMKEQLSLPENEQSRGQSNYGERAEIELGQSTGDFHGAESEQSEEELEVKDYSYLYTNKTVGISPHVTEKTGSAFVSTGSNNDSDDMEEIVSQSGRIKMLSKIHNKSSGVKRRKLDEHRGRGKKSKRLKVKRFFTFESDGQKSKGKYQIANIGKLKANENRKKKKRR